MCSIFKFEGKTIDRAEIIYSVLSILKKMGITVRVLMLEEFRVELAKEPETAKLMKKLPNELDLTKIYYGSSVLNPPSINFDLISQSILSFEKEFDIELSLDHLVLIFLLESIHEFSESEYNCEHCEDDNCPLSTGLHFRFTENELSFSLKACLKHEKAQHLLDHKAIKKLTI